jgi:hypothetical protein
MSNVQTSGALAAALNDKVINEAFEIARSNRTGILQTIGMGRPRQAYDGYKMGWLDFRVDATSSTLTSALTDNATTVAVADGSKFRAGMTLSADGSDEVMVVTAVAGNNLTVVRGVGGTSAEAVSSGGVIVIDSVGREENSGAQNDGIFQPDSVENFFQTMDTAVEFSRRALATAQFGDTNALAFQVSERIRQLTIQMDRALVRGRKFVQAIGGNDVSYTGGLRYFLDQADALKVDAGADALTLDMVNDLNELVVARGGNTNTIAVGIGKARELSKLVSANYSSERLANWTADEGSLLSLPSDLPLVGSVNQIVVDTNLGADELIIYDRGVISVVPMASNNANSTGAWETKDATQPGQDGERARIIGDFAIEVRQSKTHMARLHNIG